MSGTPKDLCTLLWKLFLWNNARYIVWVHECMLSRFNSIQLFATLWTIGHQAPLSMGILQARILECVATTFSRGSFWSRDWIHVSYVSYIGRWVLYHWAIWESQSYCVLCLVAQSCLALHNPWTIALPAPLSMGTLQARAIIWSNNSTYPKEMKNPAQKDMCTPMFTAALFTMAKIWKMN